MYLEKFQGKKLLELPSYLSFFKVFLSFYFY